MALSDELAEEILLRLPPDDPGSLVRAALSCKRALRLVADPGFRRRYRAFHATRGLASCSCHHQIDDGGSPCRLLPKPSPPPRARAAMALSDDLAEEILLRLPPDDPGSLVRAALSCKRALRLAADPGFRRRYRAFHGAAPMLGFFCNIAPTVTHFVPTAASYSSSTCLPSREVRDCCVLDVRHGRVLLRLEATSCNRLVIWDPVTDERCALPLTPVHHYRDNWNAAVLCTTAGCDHLDCHGTFTVVFVAIKEMKVFGTYLTPDVVDTYSTQDDFRNWTPNPDGIGVIFVRTSVGFFMIDLKSNRVKKVRNVNVIGASSIFPYMSFWDPALGGTSAGDGSRGAPSALPRGTGTRNSRWRRFQ